LFHLASVQQLQGFNPIPESFFADKLVPTG